MCMFPDKVRMKKIFYYSERYSEGVEGKVQKVRGDATCRSSSDEDWATLVDHHCLTEEAAAGEGQVRLYPNDVCFACRVVKYRSTQSMNDKFSGEDHMHYCVQPLELWR